MSRGNATPLFSAPLYKTHLILSSENASPAPSAHRPPVLSPFCLFIRDPRGCPRNPADWVQESMLTVSCWLIGIKNNNKKNHSRTRPFVLIQSNQSNRAQCCRSPFESLGGKKAVALAIGELVGTCELPVLTPFLLKKEENLLQVTRGDFSCKLQDKAKPSRRINIELFLSGQNHLCTAQAL